MSPSLSSPRSASPARLASKRRVPPADPPPPGRTPPQATRLPPPAACNSFSAGQAGERDGQGGEGREWGPPMAMAATAAAAADGQPTRAPSGCPVAHTTPPPFPASLSCTPPRLHMHMHPLTSVTHPPTAFTHLHMHPQDVQQLLHDAEAIVQQLHPLCNLHVLVNRPAAQGKRRRTERGGGR